MVAHLERQKSQKAAHNCLDRFNNKQGFSIHYPEESIYRDAIDFYRNFDGNGPNLYEISDYLCMKELDIEHYVGWDSDFTAFDNITLMPHGYWRR